MSLIYLLLKFQCTYNCMQNTIVVSFHVLLFFFDKVMDVSDTRYFTMPDKHLASYNIKRYVLGFRSREPPLQMNVRLVGGSSSSEGRVEVSSGGDWGTVCDDGWGIEEAKVVCRSLGYPYVRRSLVRFGEGTGPIYLDNLRCVGDEHNLTECPNLDWGVHDCDHSEDVGVLCLGKLMN